MRQTAYLSAFFLLCSVAAEGQARLTPAQREVELVRALVEAGVMPRAALEKAEQAVIEEKDELILKETLYGNLTVENLSHDQATEMVAAAQRQLARQQAKVADAKKLIAQGVMPFTSLTPVLEDLQTVKRTVDLAESRARLLEELVAMARREQEEMEQEPTHPTPGSLAERFDGSGVFSDSQFKTLVQTFQKRFGRVLPISAKGDTAFHRSLGYDHRGRVDVALNPDQPEGVWLLTYLKTARIPYFAFRAAIAGSASGPHVHLGPPSTRYRAAD